MPVVSEPTTELSHTYTYGLYSDASGPYLLLFLSILFFLCITHFIRRDRRTSAKLQYHFPPSRPSTPLPEKLDVDVFPYTSKNIKLDTSKPTQPKSIPQTQNPFDYTSPTSSPTNPQTFPRPPPPLPFTPPSPLEPLPFSPFENPIPHRRSYTKPSNALTNTPSITGEIISGDGWRRHTRVFGGGVCEACAESERRMSA